MRRKTIGLVMTGLIIFSAMYLLFGEEEDISASPTRSTNLYVGPGKDYSTIQDAINASSDGDTIHVSPGTYRENLVIKRPISLIGNGSDTTVINGQYKGDVILVNTTQVNIKDFNITNEASKQGDDPPPHQYFGIRYNSWYEHNGSVIEDCVVTDHGNVGISIWRGSNMSIRNCYVTSCGAGLGMQDSYNSSIVGCTVLSGNSGIGMGYGSDNLIEGNTIIGGREGLYVSSDHSIIRDNIIKDNSREGMVLIHDATDNLIEYNTVIGCEDFGVKVIESTGNRFQYNNFIGNNQGSVQVECNWNNYWDDGSGHGNYWDDYTSRYPNATDTGNGTYDTPYNISGPIVDNYPLTNRTDLNSVPPCLNGNENIWAAVGYELREQFWAIDEDTDEALLEWEMRTNASWLSFTSDHLLTGTPQKSDIGSYWVNISVTDGIFHDYFNTTFEVVEITDPLIILTQGVTTGLEDVLYSVDFNSTEYPNIIWSMKTNASFLSINKETGLVSGTPTNYDLGFFFVNVSVTNGKDLHYYNYSLLIMNVNDPPEICTSDVLTARVGNLYSVNYTAEDVDPTDDKLTWSLSTNASFLSINASTGVLKGTPSSNDVGRYNVKVIVNDGNNGSDSSSFTLTVRSGSEQLVLNNTPEISLAQMEGGVFQILSVNVSSLGGLNPEDLNFTWYQSGSGVLGYGSSLYIDLDPGYHNITLRITDNEGRWIDIDKRIHVKGSSNGQDEQGDEFDTRLLAVGILILILITASVMLLVFRSRRIRGLSEYPVIEPYQDMATPPPDSDIIPGPGSKTPDSLVYSGNLSDDLPSGRSLEHDGGLPSGDLIKGGNGLDFEDRSYLLNLQEGVFSPRKDGYHEKDISDLRRKLNRKHRRGDIGGDTYETALNILSGFEE